MRVHAQKTINWLDILFEGRNKDYGAYLLRKTYTKRVVIALTTAGILTSGLILASVIKQRLKQTETFTNITIHDVTLSEINKPNEPPPPPPPVMKPPPMVKVATIAFTPPKVVKDEDVMKPPPDVKQITEARIDVKTEAGAKDLGIIAPPEPTRGTQVVAAPVAKKESSDEIFTKVEIEASFPGGPDGWARYVQRAVSGHIDEFSDADFGTCIVKFVVDKTGKVSNVEAITMKTSKLAEVAVNMIRKGPNWIPAQQNGSYVNAYRLQPVTLKNPDQQ